MQRYFVFLLIVAMLLIGCGPATPPSAPTENSSSSATEETTAAQPIAGWVIENSNAYYIKEDGTRHTGWLLLGNTRYYLDKDGVLQTGWLDLDGTRYYLGEDGSVQTGWLKLDNVRYYLDKFGVLQTGWLELDGTRYYLGEDGAAQTGWLELEDKRYYLDGAGVLQTGWLVLDDVRYYLDASGALQTGWLDLDDTRYYLGTDGTVQTGWLELDGQTYYLKANGAITRGKATIDDSVYYFVRTGERIILANPWNTIPADQYPSTEELEDVEPGGVYLPVDKICVESLRKMMADCRAAGHGIQLISAYRRHSTQTTLYNNKVTYYLNLGYDEATAKTKAATVVAVPGTSEHELGLAVDLADSNYPYLDEAQEKTDTQKWLMEHCWEYGFILRYPNSKTEITGIIYEPWHYRYVGTEVAKELHSSGLCLEEYLNSLQ